MINNSYSLDEEHKAAVALQLDSANNNGAVKQKPVPVPKYRPGKWRIGTLLPAPAGSVPDDFEPYDHRADIVKGATT